MTNQVMEKSRAAPRLVARTRRCDHTLREGTEYRIGRDPSADINLDDPRVSWHHAVLRTENGVWILEDSGSTNGTFRHSERITRLPIVNSLLVRFANREDGPLLRLDPEAPPLVPKQAPAEPAPDGSQPGPDLRQPTARLPLPVKVMRIGRTCDNDLAVDDLSVSRRHAELRKSASGRYEIVDLGSYNGTFLNGERVDRAEIGTRPAACAWRPAARCCSTTSRSRSPSAASSA